MTELTRAELESFAEAKKDLFEQHLRTLVEIPSISANPDHRQDVFAVATAACEILRSVGFEAEVLETRGTPIVHGHTRANPSWPTVSIYNHLDVQPANEPEWTSDPFKLTVDAHDVYRGRGTTDDKGPALTALFGACAARDAGLPVNIQFIWETEEEIGSPSFEAALLEHRDRLRTGSVVVSDTIWVTRGRPSTPSGLRGLVSFSVSLETASHDLHSGLVGGGARNPLSELTWLIGQMLDGKTGEVKIPGFYSRVDDLSIAEARDFAASGFSVERFMADHGLKSVRVDDPLDLMMALWARPTLEVHGIVGGYTGPGIKSAVPARAEAKLSCRLVPRMTTEETLDLVSKFIHARIPDAVITPAARLEPYHARTHGPYANAVREAYRFGFGVGPAFTREGGSIGAVPTMQRILGAEVYFLGLSLPEHGYHAPNENYDWAQVQGGIPMFAHYLELVSQADAQGEGRSA
ncbi:MAG: M20/M25/M40 family metallo-hydrolase [Deltaproteobacteria bacterium]|nr:M20/M25/M40 family metallo-hydrolase [Deltaproteobacteria bacterium]